MKLFSRSKDGGPESTVTGFWLVEIKWLFSIVILKFEGKSREAYHTHAFNSISWLLKGKLTEQFIQVNIKDKIHTPSWKPILTKKEDYHKVDSDGNTYVLSFRGPWAKTWKEYIPDTQKEQVLTNGRIIA